MSIIDVIFLSIL